MSSLSDYADYRLIVAQNRRLEAENQRLREAGREACDVAIWMSGSSSFSPEGEAHEGWIKQRERLYKAIEALSDEALAGEAE